MISTRRAADRRRRRPTRATTASIARQCRRCIRASARRTRHRISRAHSRRSARRWRRRSALKMREREPLRSVYDIASLEDRIGGAFAAESAAHERPVILCVDAHWRWPASVSTARSTSRQSAATRSRPASGAWREADDDRPAVLRAGSQGDCHRVRRPAWRLALMLTRLLEGMLFGVSPTDPIVMSAVDRDRDGGGDCRVADSRRRGRR